MNYREERGGVNLFNELFPLLEEHEKELNVLSCELDVDLRMYIKAVSNRTIRVYTARDDDGVLAGYAIYFLYRHPHYNVLVGAQDVLFITKEKRRGLTGIKLIRFSEDKLKEAGVKVITQRTKKHKDLGRLYERLGYGLQEEVYTKEI